MIGTAKTANFKRHNMTLLVWLVAAVVVNVGAGLVGWWHTYWWAFITANFVLLVVIADRTQKRLHPAQRVQFEKLLAWGFPALLLLSAEIIVRAGVLSATWFPPPSRVAMALWDLTVNYDRFNETSLLGRPWLIGQMLQSQGWPGVVSLFRESHVWATLTRVFVGFAIGMMPGLLIGIIMGLNKTVRSMLDGTLSALYVLPKIAIFPLLMLMFPDPFGEGPKVAVVAISAFFLVAISTAAGVRDIDKVYLEAAHNFGARGFKLFWHVIIPAALPIIFAGLRLALGTALIVIVAVEFIRAQVGVGFVIYYHWQILAVDKMYAGLITVMALGALLTYGLQWLERKVMPWEE
jgi:ABC-type nitrate/sulfonate/bicarbonate transport system permease component